jgi:hypothetical protein
MVGSLEPSLSFPSEQQLRPMLSMQGPPDLLAISIGNRDREKSQSTSTKTCFGTSLSIVR